MLVSRFKFRCNCGTLKLPMFDTEGVRFITGIPSWWCPKCSGGFKVRTYSDVSTLAFDGLTQRNDGLPIEEYDTHIHMNLREHKPRSEYTNVFTGVTTYTSGGSGLPWETTISTI